MKKLSLLHIVKTSVLFLLAHVAVASDSASLYSDRILGAITLSPSGQQVAYIDSLPFADETQRDVVLHVHDLSSDSYRSYQLSELFDHDVQRVAQIQWADETTLAVAFFKHIENGADAIQARRSFEQYFLNVPSLSSNQRDIRKVRASAYVENPLPNREGVVLMATLGYESNLYEIEIAKLDAWDAVPSRFKRPDGGQFSASQRIAKFDGYTTLWMLSDNGEFEGAVGRSQSLKIELVRPDSEADEGISTTVLFDLKELFDEDISLDSIEYFMPIEVTESPEHFFAMRSNERGALFRFNATDNSAEELLRLPAGKILDVLTDEDHQLIGVQAIVDGRIEYHYSDGKAETQFNQRNTVQQRSTGGRTLNYVEGAGLSPRYQVTDIGGSAIFEVVIAEDVQLRNIEQSTGVVEVDGLDIPYILNLPSNSSDASLIVLVHGGPFGVFDSPYYSRNVALLSQQGYGVLRINYRGSSGYGEELHEAGKLTSFDGIPQDIVAVTRHVKSAYSNRLTQRSCVMGGSYGGYAAALLASQHPDLFKCAVSINGVSDFGLILQDPNLSQAEFDFVTEWHGDIHSESDRERIINAALPPKMAQLEIPLFIAHAKDDETVDVEHAYRLKLALEMAEKPYELYFVEQGGHSLQNQDELKRLDDEVLRFIAKYL